MFYKDCMALKFTNVLAVGTDNFRTSTLNRHVITDDSKRAVNSPNEKRRKETEMQGNF